ncbi:MAG: hypothetical protein ACRDZ3_21730 [Acidimicrobiia bacterium]
MAADEERETEEPDELPAFDDGDMMAGLDELAPPDDASRQRPPETDRAAARQQPPEPPRGSSALRPRDDTEKGLALEMGRLFGMNPRQLVDPGAPATPRRPAEGSEGDAEADDSVLPGGAGDDTA